MRLTVIEEILILIKLYSDSMAFRIIEIHERLISIYDAVEDYHVMNKIANLLCVIECIINIGIRLQVVLYTDSLQGMTNT